MNCVVIKGRLLKLHVNKLNIRYFTQYLRQRKTDLTDFFLSLKKSGTAEDGFTKKN